MMLLWTVSVSRLVVFEEVRIDMRRTPLLAEGSASRARLRLAENSCAMAMVHVICLLVDRQRRRDSTGNPTSAGTAYHL